MTKHYIVSKNCTVTAGNLNDYVELQAGSSINLTDGTVTKNIWGPGGVSFCGNCIVKADLGVKPDDSLLNPC